MKNSAVRFERILKLVSYKDWEIMVHKHAGSDTHYLQVHFTTTEWKTNSAEMCDYHHGRKWLLSPHMTDSEVVQTALLAVLTAEEHETREQFRYLDEAVFGPHISTDRLFMAVTEPGAITKRKEMKKVKA